MNIIDKLFSEPKEYETNMFHVVNDIEPVCDGHLLAFYSRNCKGIREVPSNDVTEFLAKIRDDYYQEEIYFFERGNATFCTSPTSPICSHLHIVPSKEFSHDLLQRFARIIGAIEIDSDDFSRSTNDREEYIVFGNHEKLYLKSPFSSGIKRYIREFLISEILS